MMPFDAVFLQYKLRLGILSEVLTEVNAVAVVDDCKCTAPLDHLCSVESEDKRKRSSHLYTLQQLYM